MEVLLLAGAGLAASCGQPGPPLPPSANLPQAVRNFSAQRQGNGVRLGWTVPVETTDQVRIHRPISANLCVWPGLLPGVTPPTEKSCPIVLQVVAPAPPGRLPDGVTLSIDRMARAGTDHGFVGVAVEFVNQNQKGAGWSNFVPVPLTSVSAPPANVTVAVRSDGVLLQWNSISAPERIAVYRQELNPAGQPIREPQRLALLPAAATSWLDSGAQWNRTYVYRVRAVAGNDAREVESLDSTPVRVTPRDVFPPGVPMGLQAVLAAGGNDVDLSWEPVMSADLAGYRVYRRSPGGAWTRINTDLVVTPVFRDAHPAGTAEYAVSAVDQNGNESQRSAEVDVTIPAAQ